MWKANIIVERSFQHRLPFWDFKFYLTWEQSNLVCHSIPN
ncbi:hypothetical protein JCM19238_3076 [Vibrio ponticus]|nr:hypothetical protein JCM19238_3076 [Vibrio ponticus]